jgi:FKBP-type peptidyl-prolyl cis-trans isomerase FklB
VKLRGALVLLVAWLIGVSTVRAQDAPIPLKTERDRRSFALGMDLGNQLRELSIEIDPALFGKGLADALAARKAAMTDAKVQVAGRRFPAENRKQPRVEALPSGLQYRFDSSCKRHQPATFPVKGAIKSWTEALQLTPVRIAAGDSAKHDARVRDRVGCHQVTHVRVVEPG